MEMIVSLPILVIATFAVFQFGILMLVQQAVTHAATVGVRELAKGASNDEVIASVNAVLLDSHGIEFFTTNTAGSGTKIVIEDPDDAPPTTTIGDPALMCDAPSLLLSSGEVRVTLCVDLTKDPLINPIAAFGFTLMGKRFEISAFANKE